MKNIFFFFKKGINNKETNKKKFFNIKNVLLFFVFCFLFESLFFVLFLNGIYPERFLAGISPDALVFLTNKRREDENVNKLNVNELLTKAAKLKAEDMAEKGYFAHYSPEGITPWYWLDLVGYSYKSAGENLAVNFKESYQVDNAWMNSPGHRKNIINEKFEEIGIATATGQYKGKEAIFVVQFFGTAKEDLSSIIKEEKKDNVVIETKNVLGESIFETEENNLNADNNIQEEIIIEKEIKEEESFAFIEKINDKPFSIIGNPNLILTTKGENSLYPSFFQRTIDFTKNSLKYLLIVLVFFFGLVYFIYKKAMNKKEFFLLDIYKISIAIIIAFIGFGINHYILLFLQNIIL